MTSSGMDTRAGRLATKSTASATSSGLRIVARCSSPTGVVPDEQLATVITAATDMQQCAEALGQFALDQGSRDNVSCVVVEVVEGWVSRL
jgi:hypothetical protein